MGKKIVMITGSAHHPGSSEALADAFETGAKAAGHDVYRFNAGAEQVEPLRVTADQVTIPAQDTVATALLPRLLKADIVVLVTPIYYFEMVGTLKTVIDRFYQYNHELKGKKSVLLATCNSGPDTFESLQAFYRQFTQYMRWESLGTVLADGVYLPKDLADWPAQAEALGRRL
ncbi:flavodoxin family protein [Loigolactobacillus bifermentans]|uniref:NAD(P)H dehydrogenase (Quinone) n=1 Tax=Loigolactobacillus bifermentans DSM 20003 TaxID=1423726 RepID=A0A0R1GZ54_9LACO|nr:flavodoxin family protein [Loigolactobacillus bifermentans]KRK39477.1 NAD(P)H dehydrogenase (quinone) [Loigolactobacillus bifermentans DSM 20003]QGG61244.1 flavodoxin family protein [Loigolactobacillus bifermentans]